MKTFKDNADRTWTISVTIGAVKRVKDLLKVDLLAPHEPPAGSDARTPLITRLHTDLVLLFDVIFALVKPEADKQGVTDEQFGQAMGGDAAFAAYEAFMEELVDFFQQLHRPDLAKLVQTHRAMVSKEASRAAATVDRAMEIVDERMELRRERLLQRLRDGGRGKTSTSLPASSGLTPPA